MRSRERCLEIIKGDINTLWGKWDIKPDPIKAIIQILNNKSIMSANKISHILDICNAKLFEHNIHFYSGKYNYEGSRSAEKYLNTPRGGFYLKSAKEIVATQLEEHQNERFRREQEEKQRLERDVTPPQPDPVAIPPVGAAPPQPLSWGDIINPNKPAASAPPAPVVIHTAEYKEPHPAENTQAAPQGTAFESAALSKDDPHPGFFQKSQNAQSPELPLSSDKNKPLSPRAGKK